VSKATVAGNESAIGLRDRLALRPKEVAAALGVAEKTVRNWMKDEDLPFLRLNGVVLIPLGDLQEWLSGRVTSERRADRIVEEILEDIG
jgi:excisionase family DNA binding protein